MIDIYLSSQPLLAVNEIRPQDRYFYNLFQINIQGYPQNMRLMKS